LDKRAYVSFYHSQTITAKTPEMIEVEGSPEQLAQALVQFLQDKGF
jgi:hypothetical protein